MLRMIALMFLMLPGFTFADQGDGTLEIREIAHGVYLHTSFMQLPGYGYYPSNGLLVVDGKNAYIIDTPWPGDDSQVLVQWIEASGFTLKASTTTHFHEDRSSGIQYLNTAGISTHASALTNGLLESRGNATAAHAFEGDGFWLLADRIYAYYPGAGHTRDNIVVWLPEEKILFGGCLIRGLSAKGLGNTADASLDEWAHTVQRVVDKFPDVEKVVPGHGEPGGAQLLTHTIELAARTGSRK